MTAMNRWRSALSDWNLTWFSSASVSKRRYKARSRYGTVCSNVERDKAFFDLSFGRFVAKPKIGKGVAIGAAATFLQPKET